MNRPFNAINLLVISFKWWIRILFFVLPRQYLGMLSHTSRHAHSIFCLIFDVYFPYYSRAPNLASKKRTPQNCVFPWIAPNFEISHAWGLCRVDLLEAPCVCWRPCRTLSRMTGEQFLPKYSTCALSMILSLRRRRTTHSTLPPTLPAVQ